MSTSLSYNRDLTWHRGSTRQHALVTFFSCEHRVPTLISPFLSNGVLLKRKKSVPFPAFDYDLHAIAGGSVKF